MQRNQLDILVAQSLGWEEFGTVIAAYLHGVSVKYFMMHPDDFNDEGCDEFEWLDKYGYCPRFSSDISHTQFVMSECDRLGLSLIWRMSSTSVSCRIQGSKYIAIATCKPKPRAMAMVTCLVWLNYKNYLEPSCTQ